LPLSRAASLFSEWLKAEVERFRAVRMR